MAYYFDMAKIMRAEQARGKPSKLELLRALEDARLIVAGMTVGASGAVDVKLHSVWAYLKKQTVALSNELMAELEEK